MSKPNLTYCRQLGRGLLILSLPSLLGPGGGGMNNEYKYLKFIIRQTDSDKIQ